MPSSARTTTVGVDLQQPARTSGTIRSSPTAAHDRSRRELLQPSNLGSSRRPWPYSAWRGVFLEGGGRHGMRPAAPPTWPCAGRSGGESIPPRPRGLDVAFAARARLPPDLPRPGCRRRGVDRRAFLLGAASLPPPPPAPPPPPRRPPALAPADL